MRRIRFIKILALSLICQSALAGEGKLLSTAGLTQIEGSAGGGLTPWASIAGYDTQDEISASVFTTQVKVDDYRLHSTGIALGLHDRVELSATRQTFDLTTLGGDIEQNIYGVKIRLFGDLIYTSWPQISAGVQHKKLADGAIAQALGAASYTSGSDYYLSATKVHLGAVNGYNLLWNITARASKANQTGLLGYGGVNGDSHELLLEGSLGVLLSREIAVGLEYRQKPDNLAVEEQDWADFFVAYIPNKNFNFALAWVDLGNIAGAEDQRGLYFSMTGYLK
ncbi:DUF3034 family protein [Catenovulum sediminis]|uniref:DUF3034 family protein n=1 Tax=Catenovulum sediminis TaxID=1740262 RepID=A0ABV1RMN8_9ALTE|nr:DUF3034 family protein [Catenovulum sediminis]